VQCIGIIIVQFRKSSNLVIRYDTFIDIWQSKKLACGIKQNFSFMFNFSVVPAAIAITSGSSLSGALESGLTGAGTD